jgi:exopolyphosphatase/guanosine-5'-triphosphate,3'-diphosphate pyrophosphatase
MTAPSRSSPNGGGKSRRPGKDAPPRAAADAPVYAVLDLGTNNCRLMIASLHNSQFRIIEAFSRIVRLGEGLSHSGMLAERAMDRAIRALRICAEKIEKRGVQRIRAVATQACRAAKNGRDFVRRVERETGLKLTIISPEEEAHLSVMGCASLLDGRDMGQNTGRPAHAALVMDVGGGSTELSWVELAPDGPPPPAPPAAGTLRAGGRLPRPRYWISLPIGVVTLAERFPEPPGGQTAEDQRAWFDAMVDHVAGTLTAFRDPEPLRTAFDNGHAYIVGTSGAITSLAGMHLNLERYDRARVDGLWMSRDHCRDVIDRLLDQPRSQRELEPCVGRDRADLVLAGAAILEAVQKAWPCERLRVADRGLREGLLLSMAKKKTRRRRRGRSGAKAQVQAPVPA